MGNDTKIVTLKERNYQEPDSCINCENRREVTGFAVCKLCGPPPVLAGPESMASFLMSLKGGRVNPNDVRSTMRWLVESTISSSGKCDSYVRDVRAEDRAIASVEQTLLGASQVADTDVS
jgi:hypothetical protein